METDKNKVPVRCQMSWAKMSSLIPGKHQYWSWALRKKWDDEVRSGPPFPNRKCFRRH